MKGVESLVYDTTGVGYFASSKPPSLANLSAALAKAKLARVKLTNLAAVEMRKPAAVLKLAIKGLG